jgi:CRP/FNR family cyclic AMP-dependent transcriptional regulator
VQEERRLLWYLKKIPLLEGLPGDVLQELVRSVEMREVRRRQVIYIPGDPGQSLFFLNGGRVKISKVTRDGRELTLAYRVPGQVFGELCLGEGAPREEMAEAMENALITCNIYRNHTGNQRKKDEYNSPPIILRDAFLCRIDEVDENKK